MPHRHASRDTPSTGRYGVLFIRYGVGWILVVAGVILLIVSPGGLGVEGFGLAAGSGFSILMLNFLYRLGVAGDEEREREEDARVYLAKHGHWPDEARRAEPAPERRTPPAEAAEAANAARRGGHEGRDAGGGREGRDGGAEHGGRDAGGGREPGSLSQGDADTHHGRRSTSGHAQGGRRRRGPGN